MRTKLLIFFLMLTLGVFSQKKQNWKNTFLYGFQLPDELENFSGIYLTIKYNGEPILPKSVKIGGKSIKIASEPFYLFDKSATIDHTKLPFEVQGKTYYWLLDGDMLTEMALHPNRYQIDITTANSEATKRFHLPETFDCVPENCLNVAYLQSFTATKRAKFLQEKIWKLSVREKKITLKEQPETIKDSTLTFSLRNPIPKGILMALPELNKEDHSIQEFTIDNCYWIENTFLIPIKSKIIKRQPDSCYENYATIEGKICSKSGCITGKGSGLCSKLNSSTNKIKYKLTLIIEP